MGQDVSKPIVADITVLDVVSERLYVIHPMLSNEYCPTAEANLAECLLVMLFHVPLQTWDVWKLLIAFAV
jgi:hypothetical protein